MPMALSADSLTASFDSGKAHGISDWDASGGNSLVFVPLFYFQTDLRLMGFLIGMLLEGILWFLSLFSISRQIAEPLAQALKSGEELWKPALESSESGGNLIFSIVRVVVVLFVAAGIYFFFRWLASYKYEDQGEIMGLSVEQTGMKLTQNKTGKSDSFWVRQIRKEYRNYMKLCQETWISIKAITTSRDLQENHERKPQI